MVDHRPLLAAVPAGAMFFPGSWIDDVELLPGAE